MYTGDNAKAVRSQELISATFLKMLMEESFDNISISRLCSESGVCRQTFYSMFGTKEDVLIYELTKEGCIDPESCKTPCTVQGFRRFAKNYARYVNAKKDIFSLLVKNDIIGCLYEIQYKMFMESPDFLPEITGDERIFVIDFIISGLCSVVKNYFRTSHIRSSAGLEKMIVRLFEGAYLDRE
jgi:Bacterial regulatory proteins, tetR family.